MKNHKEKIALLKKMFQFVSQTDVNVVYNVNDDEIDIGNGTLTIYDTQSCVKTINGNAKIAAHGLGRTETHAGFSGDPDCITFGEIAVEGNFRQIAKAAVIAWTEMRIDAFFDQEDCEAQAKEKF